MELPSPLNSPLEKGAKPYFLITEQPVWEHRFRYKSEGRFAGSIPGASSTKTHKTFPTIEIFNYSGPAVVIVSCVSKDEPHKAHPHSLVGLNCKNGICVVNVSKGNTVVTFSKVGIQCVTKKQITAQLEIREKLHVDPYRTGFQHKNQPCSIDLHVICLCFQVFIYSDKDGKCSKPLKPQVTTPLFKAANDLEIIKMSHCNSYCDGGRDDIIILCKKVVKDNIRIRFFELGPNDNLEWEDFGELKHPGVHRQYAICFRAPKYKRTDIVEPVDVYVELVRPSDDERSEPLPFQMLPTDARVHKRRRIDPDIATLFREMGANTPLNIAPETPSTPTMVLKRRTSEIQQFVQEYSPNNPFSNQPSTSTYIPPINNYELKRSQSYQLPPINQVFFNRSESQQDYSHPQAAQTNPFGFYMPMTNETALTNENIPVMIQQGTSVANDEVASSGSNLMNLLLNLDTNQMEMSGGEELNSDRILSYYEGNLSDNLSRNLNLNDVS